MMRRSLLRVLEIGHRRRVDMGRLIENLADEHRGLNRYTLRQVARRIRGGMPWVAALEQTAGVLSDPQLLAIRFGSQTGTLNEVFPELIASQRVAPIDEVGGRRRLIGYLIGVLLATVFVGSFLLAFVFPTFEQMAEEFGPDHSVPAAYRWVVALAQPFALLMPLVVLVIGSLFVAALPMIRRSVEHSLANSRIPWVGQRRVSELLRLLAHCEESGRPLPGALSVLARYHFDPSLRRRLLFARNEVEQGVDFWESLRWAKVLSDQEADAIAAASTAESRVWLLRRLAEQKGRRVTSAVDVWMQIAKVMVIFSIGAAVMLINVACYQMLVFFLESSL